ncbi:MAG: Uma2 family endonuclease [Acidobacteriaceae bacterium]|nr:Uma2 family endonuclease [Acidobacteriaceae bacterium]
MATATIAPPITIEQYLGFEGYPGLRDELINGEIVLSPQPKPHHQEVVDNVSLALREIFGNSAYVVKRDSNIRFDQANSMPAPDVFVVSKIAWIRAIQQEEYLSEPPLLVVEVLSPANRRRRVEEKIELYLRNGVAHVWICDPKQGQAFAARLSGNMVVQESFETISISDPIPFTLNASQFFLINP